MPDQTTKRRRRVRSPHAGVALLKPDPASRKNYWRAQFVDPDTGKTVKVRLDPLVITTAELRRDWAIRKAKALATRRTAIADGAPRGTGAALDETIARYYQAHPQLRPTTLTAYRFATDRLLAWSREHHIESADDLTRPRLMEWAAMMTATRKSAPAQGGKRGRRTPAAKARSAHTINQNLRSVRTVLGYLVDADAFARLTHDDLRRSLKRLQVSHERLAYMRPTDLRTLLEAALRHDADTFSETRAQHTGHGERGTTPRHEPIAPFVAAVLLSGMRLGEALAMQWAHVDLQALDNHGAVVGEVHLPGSTNKTHQARTIDLAVSPALRRLLAALHIKAGGKGSVFELTHDMVQAAGKRLRGTVTRKLQTGGYGAPDDFTWQALRRTCGTYLTNAPGIFEGASAYRSAKQLGHSVVIAERHYVDLARGIPRDARTLEAAMQIADVLERVIASVSGHGATVATVTAIGGAR